MQHHIKMIGQISSKSDNPELAEKSICIVLLANIESIIYHLTRSTEYFELAQTTNTLLIH